MKELKPSILFISENFPPENFAAAIRVYERGVGETLACGSGACAAAVIGISNKAMSSPVKVNFKQGSILVDYKIGSRKIYAEGSATFLEEIEIKI